MRARNALAGELKTQGQTKQAQATRQLRRPVVAAWAVNQLVHHAPEKLERLMEAARALEKAHRRALSGLGAEDLKVANRAFQQALDPLMAEASATLSAAGRPPTSELTRQIEETLRAGSLGTEEERAPLAQGMLTQPLRQSGFGALSPLLLVGPSPEARTRPKARAQKPTPRATRPPAPTTPAPPAEGVVLRGPWRTRDEAEEAPEPPAPPPKRQSRETRTSQAQAQRAAKLEQRRQENRKRALEAEARRNRDAELARLRQETKQRARDAEARRERDAELTRLRREARQQVERAERTERGASLDVKRAEALLKAAQAKTQRMREAFEQAEAAEQQRAEEVAHVREEAQTATRALEQARSALRELDSRLSP
ncbi:hypothetical protein [Hyalangium rubrum]|uniref:TolA protein n=1 Tax=Hyalangium rubrum TaxID=3103134 RepID=A0ABU5HJY2_9BACT|nr:hypothetical protein [Hyalangium sp. s54d21]MDY7233127.1 hypothetical protein [Hyalangium sp. s54d21]